MKVVCKQHPAPLTFTAGQSSDGEAILDVRGPDGFRVQIQLTTEEAANLGALLLDIVEPEFYPTHPAPRVIQ